LLIRTSSKGEALLVFVTQTSEFPYESDLLGTLTREFPQLIGIHQNVNPARTNVILGRQWRKCAGQDALEERLGGLRFRLSPGSFFQVNTPQAEVLYDAIKERAGRGQVLLDLYCGVGGIALWLAGNFQQVLGVDEVKNAIFDAQKNAEINLIKTVRFLAAPAEQFIGRYRLQGRREDLTVILDPPRAGCDPRVLSAISRLKPGNLLYVSCDPGTLARDLAILAGSGYIPRKIQPVDLFPHTAHIETVVHLSSRTR
jgi:23S rRNA (uracil1939-C5)-methyltransferase